MFHIEGRRWFNKSKGHTYHSVRIWKDGQFLVCIPYTYGYGDQYLDTALGYLSSNGLVSPDIRYWSPEFNKLASTSVITVTRRIHL